MTDAENLPALPEKWCWTTIGEFSEVILGQSPPSSTYNENGVGLPFYQGKAEFGETYPTTKKWCTSPKKLAEKGDVLISVRAPVGPTNICPEKSCIGRGLAAIRGLDNIDPFFVLYVLRTYENQIAGKGTGTTFNAITGDQLKNFEIPLLPLPEQHRIVQKIEELFTDLDAGVKELEKAKVQIRNYRQAVLKAAVQGKIVPTEAEIAEKEGRDFESARSFLERILEERGLKTKSNGSRISTAYKSKSANSRTSPKGWYWTTYEQIGDWMGGGTPKTTDEAFWQDGTIPWVSPKDMKSSKI